MSRGELVLVLLPKLPEWWLLNVACARAGIAIIIFFLPSVSMIPRDFGKKLSEIQNVGVTITPGSPRG